MLLAIDTSAGTSVAVVDVVPAGSVAPGRGVVVSEESEPDTRHHAEAIDTLIERALRRSGVGPDHIEAVVAGMGPGPFTGLRVGIAAARAFALGIGRPVIPIVSHDSVAFGRGRRTLVVTDVRRREVAWSTYDLPESSGIPARLDGPSLVSPTELGTVVPDYDRFDRIDAAEISAGALGCVAVLVRAAGRIPELADPLYLRAPDVTATTAPKRVTG